MGKGLLIIALLTSQVFVRPYYWRGSGLFLQDVQPLPPPRYPETIPCEQCSQEGVRYSPVMKGNIVDTPAYYNNHQGVLKSFNTDPFTSH